LFLLQNHGTDPGEPSATGPSPRLPISFLSAAPPWRSACRLRFPGISPAAVEKDYWVSEALRALASGYGDDFVFKGGTSLSKGYRIIELFSEDIGRLEFLASAASY
jgi:hypothetical protein